MAIVCFLVGLLPVAQAAGAPPSAAIALPAPVTSSQVSIEEALHRRRSARAFLARPLTAKEYGQLLWAAQGVTEPSRGYRTAPSAGALFPLEVYVATAEGVFRYLPKTHALQRHLRHDVRAALFRAALRQEAVRDAPAVFILVGVYERTAGKYGRPRATRYVHLEAGHAAQNLLLQAVSLGLAGVPIGGFDDEKVRARLELPESHRPLYLVPAGRPASPARR